MLRGGWTVIQEEFAVGPHRRASLDEVEYGGANGGQVWFGKGVGQ